VTTAAAGKNSVRHVEGPEVFTPNLAMSLNRLAAMLSELGQREEAAAREAAGLYRDLARARPKDHPQRWLAE
jgi:hypothetical protein